MNIKNGKRIKPIGRDKYPSVKAQNVTLIESITKKALNGLHKYCQNWKLNVNIDKTKVSIFYKSRVRKFKSFNFGDHDIDVVDDYVYLGTTFNYNSTFDKAMSKRVG